MEFVVHDGREGGRENFAWLIRLVRGKVRVDIVAETIVTLLPEVQQQSSEDPSAQKCENDRDSRDPGFARHRGSFCTARG
jgi:hypothetical protein